MSAVGGCESGATSGTDPEDKSEVEYVDYRDLTAASCLDICTFANDGACDEPFICDLGSDCTDCGGTPTTPTVGADDCVDTCRYANDGTCDVPYLCPTGTDCSDCEGRGESCDDSCEYYLDGKCDAPGACARGTDCGDCGGPADFSVRRVVILIRDPSCTDATVYVNGGRLGTLEPFEGGLALNCVGALAAGGATLTYDLPAGVTTIFEARGSCNHSYLVPPLEGGDCKVVCLGCA